MKEIKLTQGKIALVDDEDYDYLMQWKWFAARCFENIWYARRAITLGGGNQRLVPMHREVTKAPNGMVVDHIDHNGLNNQKSNLRICTQQQNKWNSVKDPLSKNPYKGVHRRRSAPHTRWRYRAYIMINGKLSWLGSFDTAIEAALTYDKKARELFGEFAYVNFPDNG